MFSFNKRRVWIPLRSLIVWRNPRNVCSECGWRKRTRRFLQKEYFNPKAKWGKGHDAKFRRSERSREKIVDIECALGSFQEAHESWLTEGPWWDRKFARILRHGSASGGWYEAIDRRLDAKFFSATRGDNLLRVRSEDSIRNASARTKSRYSSASTRLCSKENWREPSALKL